MNKRIEAFINNELSDKEIKELEAELQADKQLAEELAFYLSVKKLASQSPNESKLEKRHKEWQLLKKKNTAIRLLQWRSAVAALVVIGLGLAWFLKTGLSSNLTNRSNQYISANFQTLGVRMSGSEKLDSLQTAINLFNSGNIQGCLAMCEEIIRQDPENTEALKTAGIAALRSNDYNKSIGYFRRLGNNTSLYSNPGRFYEALALLQKGGKENVKRAEKLLEEVITKDLEGKKEAEKW